MGSKGNNWASYLGISREMEEHRRAWEQVSIILLDKGLRVRPGSFLAWDLECSKEDLRAF